MAKNNNRKNTKKKTLKKFSKGGFSKKEIKKLSKKLNVSIKRATKLTTNYTKKNTPKPTKKSSFSTKNTKTPSFNPFTPKNISKPFKRKPEKTWRPPMAPVPSIDPFVPKTSSPFKPPQSPTLPPPPTPTVLKVKEKPPIKMGTGTNPTHSGPDVTIPLADIGTDIERSIPATDPNNMMDSWKEIYNTANETYRENINALRSTIGGYETRLGTMSTQLANLGKQYREEESEQEKFKAGDAEYVRGGSARGVRLRRSKAFESGAYAQGTSRLNRRNRMKAQGVNL